MKKNVHRMKYMEYMLEKYNIPLLSSDHSFHVMEGIDVTTIPQGFRGHTGSYGATESHLCCLRDAQSSNLETILVLEDDCLPHKDFWDLWSQIEIPDDWNMIFLGAIQMRWTGIKQINPHVYKALSTLSAHSYITKKSYIPIILTQASTCRIPIDELFTTLQTKFPSYVLTPNLLINHVNESFVRTRNTWSIENKQSQFRWNLSEYDTEKTPLSFRS